MANAGTGPRERVMEIARTLPPAPKVLAGLDQLLRDANNDLGPIADLIRRDAALATQVIRISNSVVFATGNARVGTVEEAVARIGFREIYRMVSLVSTERLVDRPLQYYDVTAERLRENMLYTALACEALAEVSGGDPRQAYTAGLLRTLGMLVLDRLADVIAVPRAFAADPDGTYSRWEGAVFGFGHSEIAGLILEEWAFPAEIVEAVRGQHLQEEADRQNRLAGLLHLACSIVSGTHYGLPGEAGVWNITPTVMQLAGISFAQLDKAGRKALKAFEDISLRYKMGAPRPAVPIETVPSAPDKSPKSCDSEPVGSVLGVNDGTTVQTTSRGVTAPTDFTTFMRNYQDMVYSTAVRIIGNETHAEDIAQEVFIKAHDHWDNLQGSPTAGGWLKTVATNLSINHVQRYKKRWRFFSDIVHTDDEGGETEVEFAAPDTFFSGVDAGERREWVERALAMLPEHQRVPLVLFHFENMPYDQIARKLGVSLSKVKTDILRAREALAKILARTGASHEQFQM